MHAAFIIVLAALLRVFLIGEIFHFPWASMRTKPSLAIQHIVKLSTGLLLASHVANLLSHPPITHVQCQVL